MDGYSEAGKIDKQLSDLLGKNEVTKDNCLEWLKFIRTVESTLIILREVTEEMAYEAYGTK